LQSNCGPEFAFNCDALSCQPLFPIIEVRTSYTEGDVDGAGGLSVGRSTFLELRKTWKYGAEAFYIRDPDGHLLDVVTPGVWSIY